MFETRNMGFKSLFLNCRTRTLQIGKSLFRVVCIKGNLDHSWTSRYSGRKNYHPGSGSRFEQSPMLRTSCPYAALKLCCEAEMVL